MKRITSATDRRCPSGMAYTVDDEVCQLLDADDDFYARELARSLAGEYVNKLHGKEAKAKARSSRRP